MPKAEMNAATNWPQVQACGAVPDPHERLAEIAEVLAAGFMRLWAQKSRGLSADTGESSLHLAPERSGHPNPASGRDLDA